MMPVGHDPEFDIDGNIALQYSPEMAGYVQHIMRLPALAGERVFCFTRFPDDWDFVNIYESFDDNIDAVLAACAVPPVNVHAGCYNTIIVDVNIHNSEKYKRLICGSRHRHIRVITICQGGSLPESRYVIFNPSSAKLVIPQILSVKKTFLQFTVKEALQNAHSYIIVDTHNKEIEIHS
tara:strand:+ start:318 stop:854 length:537 start_codon:yes stop_codon:yes gene_type:complete